MIVKNIDHLLKSSIPLEHQIAALANEKGFFNCGEFSYSRINDSGRSTEFSVDLLISADLYTKFEGVAVDKNLNILIECKYASPSVSWVFSTAPKHEPMIMTAFSCYQWVGTHLMQGFGPMLSLEPSVYCTRGVSLSSTSADPTQIRHGLQQIRYAVPKLLENLLDSYSGCDEPAIPIIAPLLVTNAPLFVLNADATVSTTEQAQSLQEVATEHTHLSVYPRRFVSDFDERHPGGRSIVVDTSWILDDTDVAAVAAVLGDKALIKPEIGLSRGIGYEKEEWDVSIDDAAALAFLMDKHELDAVEREVLKGMTTAKAAVEAITAQPQQSPRLQALLSVLTAFRDQRFSLAVIEVSPP